MNSAATNYDSKAKKSDEASCTFSENLIIWQDQTAAQSWSGLATVLKIYIDNVYAGSFSASEYSPSMPDCSGGSLKKTIDFGKSISKVVNIKIKDESDFQWYNEDITMTAGNCSYYKVQ